jgi:hypothetical protein
MTIKVKNQLLKWCGRKDFNKADDSVRREALYNILTEFGIPRKLSGDN